MEHVEPKGENAVTCLNCGKRIVSRYRHDFVGCDCEDEQVRVYVDGGNVYTRFLYGPKARWRNEDGIEYDAQNVG